MLGAREERRAGEADAGFDGVRGQRAGGGRRGGGRRFRGGRELGGGAGIAAAGGEGGAGVADAWVLGCSC